MGRGKKKIQESTFGPAFSFPLLHLPLPPASSRFRGPPGSLLPRSWPSLSSPARRNQNSEEKKIKHAARRDEGEGKSASRSLVQLFKQYQSCDGGLGVLQAFFHGSREGDPTLLQRQAFFSVSVLHLPTAMVLVPAGSSAEINRESSTTTQPCLLRVRSEFCYVDAERRHASCLLSIYLSRRYVLIFKIYHIQKIKYKNY